jgi:DNA repair exonuclease SbcCD ATPase subunit
METWIHWLILVLGGIANAIAVGKGISYYADRMYDFHKEAMTEAIKIHRAEAAATEGRLVKLENNYDKLRSDHEDTRGQLTEIKDMLGEVREALYSMLKK